MFIMGSLEWIADFPLVLIELFSLGVTAEALRAKIDWKSAISIQRSQFDPKFQVEGVAPQPFYKKTRRNDHSFIKIWTGFSSVLSQFTRLTDRQTDGRTKFSSLDRVCILCSAVKIKLITSELQCSVFVCLLVYSVQSCIRRRSINTRRRPQPNRSRQMTRLNESKEPNSLSSTPSFVNIQHAKYRVLTGQRFSTERART